PAGRRITSSWPGSRCSRVSPRSISCARGTAGRWTRGGRAGARHEARGLPARGERDAPAAARGPVRDLRLRRLLRITGRARHATLARDRTSRHPVAAAHGALVHVVLRLQRLPVLSKRQGLAAAGLAFLLPAVHPVLRPLVGVPSHLLWFAHGLPVAVATYLFGVRGAVGAMLLSIGAVSAGERLFGAGYGRGSDDATILALSAAVAF